MNIISGSDKQIYNLGTFNKTNNGYSFQVRVNPSLGALLFFTMTWEGLGKDMILLIPEAGKSYFIGQVSSMGDQGYIILPTFQDKLTFNIINAQIPGPPLTENWEIKVYQAKDPNMLDSFSQNVIQAFPPGPPSFMQWGVWSGDPNIAFDRLYIRERTGQPGFINGFSYFIYKGFHADFSYHIEQVIPFSYVIPAWSDAEMQFDQGVLKIGGTSYGIGTTFPIWIQAGYNAGTGYPKVTITRRQHLIRTN